MVTPISRVRDGQDGIGLIEIVVSILLLGLLAVSALPLMVQALQQGPKTAAIATSTELTATRLGNVKQADTCIEVAALHGTVLQTVGSTEYRIVTTVVGTCPATFPGTMRVTVAAGPSSGATLSTADLLAWVGAAS